MNNPVLERIDKAIHVLEEYDDRIKKVSNNDHPETLTRRSEIEFAVAQLELARGQYASAEGQEKINRAIKEATNQIMIATWVLAIAGIAQIIMTLIK